MIEASRGAVRSAGRAPPVSGTSFDVGMALSIDVEDWFHAESMKPGAPRGSWNACVSRVERNTSRMLEILADGHVRATFFVLGWVAERFPRLVRDISAAGHEVASHGYDHELVYAMTPEALRADVARSRALLEDIAAVPVRGYRAPCFSITDWAIDILQEEGYEYDSSAVAAIAHDRYSRLSGIDCRQPILELRDGFSEVCVSCVPLGRRGIPWGGGGYFRLVPYSLWMGGIAVIRRAGLPYVFYIHPWEIDPGHPIPRGISRTDRFRHRVNLDRCERRFAGLAAAFDWMTVGALLDRWHKQRRVRPTVSGFETAGRL